MAGGVVVLRLRSPSQSHLPFLGVRQLGQECSLVWAAVTRLLQELWGWQMLAGEVKG